MWTRWFCLDKGISDENLFTGEETNYAGTDLNHDSTLRTCSWHPGRSPKTPLEVQVQET